jgi:hypothetical protein
MRLKSILLVVVVLGVLVGCGGDGASSSTPADDAYNDTTSEQLHLHQYEVNEEGTIVTEIDTGVMWEQSGGWQTLTWQEANDYCEQLSLGGYDNWELPEKDLLMELFERDAYEWHSNDSPPYINDIFDCRLGEYWSSTSTYNDFAHTVSYEDNPNNWQLLIWDNRSMDESHYVRCVCLDSIR